MDKGSSSLSRTAMGLGLVGLAIICLTAASVLGLTGSLDVGIPLPGGGVLPPVILAPFVGLAGLLLALVARGREGRDVSTTALWVNATVVIGSGLLMLLAAA